MALQKTYDDVIERVNKGLWKQYTSIYKLRTEQDIINHFSEIYGISTDEVRKNLDRYITNAIMELHQQCL